MNVRMARLEDSAALLKIYAQYIDSPVTFERVLPSEREFAARIGVLRRFTRIWCAKGITE